MISHRGTSYIIHFLPPLRDDFERDFMDFGFRHPIEKDFRISGEEPSLDGGIPNGMTFREKSQFIVLLAANRRVGVRLNVVLHVGVSQTAIALFGGIALDVPLLDSIGGIVLAASLKLIVLRRANDFGVFCEGAFSFFFCLTRSS